MRPREKVCIVSFHTTAEAMEFERICKEHDVTGRLIPVPRIISAGCGLAWKMKLEDRGKLVKLLDETELKWEDIQELEL